MHKDTSHMDNGNSSEDSSDSDMQRILFNAKGIHNSLLHCLLWQGLDLNHTRDTPPCK